MIEKASTKTAATRNRVSQCSHRITGSKTRSSGSPSVRSIRIPHSHTPAGPAGGEIESGARLFPRPPSRSCRIVDEKVFGSLLLALLVFGWHGYEKARMDPGRILARACIDEQLSHGRGQTERVIQLTMRQKSARGSRGCLM